MDVFSPLSTEHIPSAAASVEAARIPSVWLQLRLTLPGLGHFCSSLLLGPEAEQSLGGGRHPAADAQAPPKALQRTSQAYTARQPCVPPLPRPPSRPMLLALWLLASAFLVGFIVKLLVGLLGSPLPFVVLLVFPLLRFIFPSSGKEVLSSGLYVGDAFRRPPVGTATCAPGTSQLLLLHLQLSLAC